jgi:hypothetical protein
MYLLIGAFGARLDKTTETLAPNYSKPFFAAGIGPGAHRGGSSTGPADPADAAPFMDDWDSALAKALAEHKSLAINFTGVT